VLVLTRKKNESIVLNDNIEITIVDVQGDQVRVGINAPKSVSIYRKEIFLEIQAENKKAADVKSVDLKNLLK
jgi:carbon storage regulator